MVGHDDWNLYLLEGTQDLCGVVVDECLGGQFGEGVDEKEAIGKDVTVAVEYRSLINAARQVFEP